MMSKVVVEPVQVQKLLLAREQPAHSFHSSGLAMTSSAHGQSNFFGD